tara:strand:+ start:11533 stop:12240 length:708 start_codon:yes stop_codon:yes gene_type:complete
MINQIYQVLLSIVNKENSGYISPTEFNLIAANVQNEILAEYFSEENRNKVKENRGLTNKGHSNLDFLDRQKIEQFAESIGVTQVGTTFPLPTNLYYIEDDGVSIAGNIVVEEVERAKMNYLARSEAAPTEQYPVYTRYSNAISVLPLTITQVVMEYLRKPNNPQWTYQVIENPDGSTIELYDPTSSSFQDFELHEGEFSNIVMRMLVFFGINLREGEIAKLVEVMKDKSFNKEIQ